MPYPPLPSFRAIASLESESFDTQSMGEEFGKSLFPPVDFRAQRGVECNLKR